MTRVQLRRLLFAPEIIVVDLADRALVALRHALLVQHPALDRAAPRGDGDTDVASRAIRVLTAAARLRRALRDYRVAVDGARGDHDRHDLPF
jgi:hypothetical protein